MSTTRLRRHFKLPTNERLRINKGTSVHVFYLLLLLASLSNTLFLWRDVDPDVGYLLTLGQRMTITSNDGQEQSLFSATSSTAMSLTVNWTQRVHQKRQWLEYILSSLPQETVQKPRLYHFNGTKGLSLNLCEEVSVELEDSWVIHSPFGQASTTKDSKKALQSSFNHTTAQHTNGPTLQPGQESPKRHKHAIVIPYRDRPYHLKRFIDYMDYYLYYHYQKDLNQSEHEFSLFIMDQADSELFNRALLMNAGLDHVSVDTECVTIHDVDMIPAMFVTPLYHSCSYPNHLASLSQSNLFDIPFRNYAGGVMTIHQQHWASINGMDNQFQGWGWEDSDMFYRLMFLGLVRCRDPRYKNETVPHRPEADHVLTTISQSDEHHTRGRRIRKALQTNKNRMRRFQRTVSNCCARNGFARVIRSTSFVPTWPTTSKI